jgi:endonuclease/exonuclease/phosphatase family metal-dependent hydrolase
VVGQTESRGRPVAHIPVGSPGSEKIAFKDLERLLQDIDVPDREIRPYLTGDQSASRAFAPVIQPDPSRVEFDHMDRFRVEGAFAMNWANGVARWRRQARFKRRRLLGERLPVIVSEGDSWFQFPILLDDIIDQFDKSYHIWCVSAAGDTLENMVNQAPEFLEAIAQQEEIPRVFLFSGAGNDIVGTDPDGTSVVYRVLRDFEAGRPASWYLETDAFAERLSRIGTAYRTMLESIEREFNKRVSVVMHGYDYAIPALVNDLRHPSWAKVDEWLGEPLSQRGINDPTLRSQIVKLMIDQLNNLQMNLCGGNGVSTGYKSAFHIDVRKTLRTVSDWADELHPTDDGFRRAAERFQPVLKQLVGREERAMVSMNQKRIDPSDMTRSTESTGMIGISQAEISRLIASSVSDALRQVLGTSAIAPEIAPDAKRHVELQQEADGDLDAVTTPVFVSEVPFIEDPAVSGIPFSDLGPQKSVDDPENMLSGFRKLRLEAAVGRELTAPSALLEVLASRRRAVARIRARGVDFQGHASSGFWHGTGFLVGRNLLLTNNHVLNSIDVAASAFVEFDYEVPSTDLLSGTSSTLTKKTFRLSPDRLFVTSPVDSGLDFTFVWIDEAAEREQGSIPMERASFTVRPGEQAFVIHHPRGEPKQVSLDDTDIVNIQSTVIHYSSDTDYGSSGAPVLDQQGRLIALHHAREERDLTLPDSQRTNVINEGVKIGAIAIDLETRIKTQSADAAMAATVLASIKGSDSLTGFFGGLGRSVGSARGVEAVVGAYRGTDQDVDIGFWNVEWLANRWRDSDKLSAVARVIADLNLDIWGLSEVSPAAVEALVGRLHELFGEHYDFALSESGASEGKQSTAVIWRKSNVQGERVAWPQEAERMLHLDSRDPGAREEAVHGKIFNRYPGLFRFTLLDEAPTTREPSRFDFHLVPLHLKAMAEGSLRRRLAARILARAVKSLIDDTGDADVILGGDMNASLASGDFDALRSLGFIPMGAEDEAMGGFTYLKSPRSMIDNIFLSPNLTKTAGAVDYFIVAKERTVDDFVKKVSDHRPVLLRISLSDQEEPRQGEEADADIDTLIEQMLTNQTSVSKKRRRAGKLNNG